MENVKDPVKAARKSLSLTCRRAQTFDLRFQRRDARIALRQRDGDIGCLETLRNVLRAVCIPGRNGEQNHLLGTRLVILRHQLRSQFRVAFFIRRRWA